LTKASAACFDGGLGNHVWDLSVEKFTIFLKLKTCTSLFYCLGIMFIKLSLLFFYLQFAVEKRFRVAVYSLMAVVTGYSLASALVVIFSCYPFSKSWDITITDGFCVNLPVFYIANLSLNSATDIAVLILPLPMLWKLRMPFQQKIAVLAIFMTGSGVCVVSILRIRSLVILLDKDDVTWELVEGYIWSAIELNTAIVCATLPFTKQFLRGVCPRRLGTAPTPKGSASGLKSSGFRRMPAQAAFELECNGGEDIILESSLDRSIFVSESRDEIVTID